jgi:hypothetical protein
VKTRHKPVLLQRQRTIAGLEQPALSLTSLRISKNRLNGRALWSIEILIGSGNFNTSTETQRLLRCFFFADVDWFFRQFTHQLRESAMIPLRRLFLTLPALAVLVGTSAAQPPGRGGFGENPLIRALDRDGDGEISSRELKDASASLKRVDRNRDGQITMDEARPSYGGSSSGRPTGGSRGGEPRSHGASTLERSGLALGQQMPDVTVFDANGDEFSLSSVKGKYAVLVFGCLT